MKHSSLKPILTLSLLAFPSLLALISCTAADMEALSRELSAYQTQQATASSTTKPSTPTNSSQSYNKPVTSSSSSKPKAVVQYAPSSVSTEKFIFNGNSTTKENTKKNTRIKVQYVVNDPDNFNVSVGVSENWAPMKEMRGGGIYKKTGPNTAEMQVAAGMAVIEIKMKFTGKNYGSFTTAFKAGEPITGFFNMN